MKRILKAILLISVLSIFMQSCEAFDEIDAETYEAYENGTISQYKGKYGCPDGTIFRKKGAAYGCYDDNRRWF